MNDISIDLETLGTAYNAPILSIGAQLFDRDTGKLGATFYRKVDMDDAMRFGQVAGSTIRWWMEQSDAARSEFKHTDGAVSLTAATSSFCSWVVSVSKVEHVRLWGNGATFDLGILEYAILQTGVAKSLPCRYYNMRDMRTTLDDAFNGDAKRAGVKRTGTHHNALADATYQAQVIAACRMKIGGALGGQPLSAQVTATEDDEL
jgi:hypothetical protein